MGELSLLRDLVVIFAVAVVIVALLKRVKIPPIAGFIVAGVLVGPHALGLVREAHDVEVLAEVGVVLLMFGIGLELSLDRLRRLWRPIIVGGALQVGLTTALAFVAGRLLGLAAGPAVFLGFLVAVSSTAIVLRGLQVSGEVDAPHGRVVLGVLVFQDLSVVPMMLALPLLAGAGARPATIAFAALKSVLVLGGVLLVARLVLPRALRLLARTRERDVFILAVFLACIGTAWAATLAGVSLALGAFLGGLVVADSEFRHQALADLIPFRETFASVFFVSVGMLLDLRVLTTSVGPVAAALAAILLGKLLVVLALAAIMRLPLRVAVLAGVALAQVGEFAFVLLGTSAGKTLLGPGFTSVFVAAAILSMLLTPLALALGPHLAAGMGRIRSLTRLLDVRASDEAQEGVAELADHVIVAGFGLAGRALARILKEHAAPYLLVDLNPQSVREASRAGEPAFYGDVTSAEVLHHLGVERARELIVVVNDPGAAERAARAARRLAPRLHITVRTRYQADVPGLLAAGATEVVVGELETAVETVRRALGRLGADPARVDYELALVRLGVPPPARTASGAGPASPES
jgi:CPA2 family monovalent cation:H+ antiporter-2